MTNSVFLGRGGGGLLGGGEDGAGKSEVGRKVPGMLRSLSWLRLSVTVAVAVEDMSVDDARCLRVRCVVVRPMSPRPARASAAKRHSMAKGECCVPRSSLEVPLQTYQRREVRGEALWYTMTLATAKDPDAGNRWMGSCDSWRQAAGVSFPARHLPSELVRLC